jgi:hypothetical protein
MKMFCTKIFRNLSVFIILVIGFLSGCDTIVIITPAKDIHQETLLPTQTKKPVPPTMTPTLDANVKATIESYRDSPPVGTWCAGGIKGGIRACIGGIQYLDNIGNIKAPENTRFLVAIITIFNSGQGEKKINPEGITLTMSDGRTYKYNPDKYSYWGFELQEAIVSPSNSIQGGQVFWVPKNVGPRSFNYFNEIVGAQIVVDLERPPDYPEED